MLRFAAEPLQNAAVWYAVFLVVVWLLSIIRDHVDRQRSKRAFASARQLPFASAASVPQCSRACS